MGTASRVPLEKLAGRCSLRHAALVAADAVPQSFNTVHVALRWGRGHSNSGQPVAAQALAPRLSKLPLLGSNQDSPDPERRLACESLTYQTYTNREIVSSVCRESMS